MFTFNLGTPGYNSLRAPQQAVKKDLKVVETQPWQCQSIEPKDASLVHLQPTDGEAYMETYPGE